MRKLLWSVPLTLLACAPKPVGVQGGVLVPYGQFTRKADRIFTAGACRDRYGTPVSSPDDVEYELHQSGGQAQFLEHAVQESHARLMNNRWVDAGGTHYFIWLRGVRGFEYVIPQEHHLPALRRVYRNPRVRTFKLKGYTAVQPVGEPDITCELLAMR